MRRYRRGRIALAVVRCGAAAAPVLQQSDDGRLAVAADLRLAGDASPDLLEGWRRAGLDFATRLDGDFALALWDETGDRLVLARDRLGVRPLFWAERPGGGIAFASFPEALIARGAVTGRFNRQQMALTVADIAGAGADTLLEGVRRVEPGTVLVFGPEDRQQHRYWRLSAGAPEHVGFEDAARRLRQSLEQAVTRALPGSGPVATHLSGGLDSATVTALAAHALAGSGRAVTGYCFATPASRQHLGARDESGMAEAVAARTGVALRLLRGDQWRGMLEGPLSPTFLLPVGPDCPWDQLLGSVEGTDRVLCGYGGDDLVSYNGTGALGEALLTLRWLRLWRMRGHTPFPFWHGLLREAAAAALPDRLEASLRRLVGKAPPKPMTHLRHPVAAGRPPVATAERLRARLESPSLVRRLEEQAWYAARHGLRYVFPLLDWRLLEDAIRLPIHLQLRGGQRRALLRRAMADLLPEALLTQGPKLNPDPTGAYYLATRRAELAAEARRLAGIPAASSLIDLPAIAAVLEALPAPDAVAGSVPRQAYFPELNVALPLMAARVIAAAEERAAAEPAALTTAV